MNIAKRTLQVLLLVLLALTTASAWSAFNSQGNGKTPAKRESKSRFQLLTFLVKVLGRNFDTDEEAEKANDDNDKQITIMTWNILAPMWVDKQGIKSRGIIDLNLLNDEVRLSTILDRVLDQQPNIINFQEVQQNTYAVIKRRLSKFYSPVAFAPNIKEYWKSYLKEGEPYQKNGVASFYKKKMFGLISHKAFETSDQGSIALVSVLRRRKDFRNAKPIVVVNFHLEAASTAEGALARIMQGNAIINEVDKQLKEINDTKMSKSEPVVFLGGDVNTQSPFPGYNNFKVNGYSFTSEEVGKTNIPTFYFESPIVVPSSAGNRTLEWSAIDHILIRGIDKSSGKVSVISADAPDVDSDEFTEEAYVKRLTKTLLKKLSGSAPRKFWMTLRSDLFTTIVNITKDGNEYDQKANRVLRLGSDHLPVTVKIQMN